MNQEAIEAFRHQALYKWKWRNPLLVAILTFLHPLGMLLSSVPAFFLYLALWTIMVVYYPAIPNSIGVLVALGFAIYAYHHTRFKNSAIEKWKYGLPGTGLQNPNKIKKTQK